jgi:hypothetical protein
MAQGMSDAAALADLINAANRVVVFTGAGISTESGIPDFRSPLRRTPDTTPSRRW